MSIATAAEIEAKRIVFSDHSFLFCFYFCRSDRFMRFIEGESRKTSDLVRRRIFSPGKKRKRVKNMRKKKKGGGGEER